jgi:lipooligosaccharide transport system permease protein
VTAISLSPPPAAIPQRLGLPRGALYMLERNLYIYRHNWYLLLAEVFEPVLYLLSIGVGIGELVGHIPGLGAPDVTYAAFVAPALLTTAAMNGAMNETTFNMYGKLRLTGTYEAITSSPMAARHIALGEALWAVLRGTLITCGFLIVVTILGLAESPGILLVIPGAALVGFAFASAGLVVVTYLRDFQDFQYIQLAMLPMFLFATTFYPLGVYPRWLQIVVECLPLYQSIALVREPALGEFGLGLLVPVCYLAVMGLVSLRWAVSRIGKVLEK